MHRRTRLFAVAALAALALIPMLSPAYGDDRIELGGGKSTGTIDYVGDPLPKVLSVCAQNLSFTLGSLDDPTAGWQSDAFVVNAPGTQYAGPVRMTGGGGSDTSCESYSSGGGVITMELSGFNPLTGATLACDDEARNPLRSRPLTGRYTRIASNLSAIVTGHCLVNGTPSGQLTFVVEAQAAPRDAAGGEGTARAVRSMTTSGAFVRSGP